MKGRGIRMRKDVVGCVSALIGKMKLLGQFEYGNRILMSASSVLCVCSKE